MWGGLLANIPAGWALCNGANGTPDLRDRFVKGAANGANPGGSGGGATHTHTATGPTDHTISAHAGATVADHAAIIAHTHGLNVQGGTTAAVTGTHVMTSTATGGSARAITTGDAGLSSGTGATMAHTIGQASNHSTLTHAATTLATASSEPVYYALAFIQKT